MNKIQSITIFVLFLLCGTFCVTLSKIAYGVESEGRNGDIHKFEKPLFFNWTMFFGMMLCLIIYFVQYIILKKGNEEKKVMTFKQYLLIIIPALFDFFATYLMNFGLLAIPSSVYQMMRGSIVIFTAILAFFVRKQKIFSFQWVSVILVIVALVIVGSSSFLPEPNYVTKHNENKIDSENDFSMFSSSSNGLDEDNPFDSVTWKILGIIMIIIAQFLQAFQTILEEKYLQDIKAPVTFIVGLEGLYGFIICSIMIPIVEFVPFPESWQLREDTTDTFIMLAHSWELILLTIGYIITIFVFNFTGMMITDAVNAMVRNIMEPLRMISIWVFSVSIFWFTWDDTYGGEWIGWNTLIEIIGFVILICGSLMYYEVIKIPKLFKYPLTDSNNQNKPLLNDETEEGTKQEEAETLINEEEN